MSNRRRDEARNGGLPALGELLAGETQDSRTFLRGIVVGALVGAVLAGLAAGRDRLRVPRPRDDDDRPPRA